MTTGRIQTQLHALYCSEEGQGNSLGEAWSCFDCGCCVFDHSDCAGRSSPLNNVCLLVGGLGVQHLRSHGHKGFTACRSVTTMSSSQIHSRPDQYLLALRSFGGCLLLPCMALVAWWSLVQTGPYHRLTRCSMRECSACSCCANSCRRRR